METEVTCKSTRVILYNTSAPSLTKVTMTFVHLLCYLIRPYPSKTHCSDDLFIINAAIMQLATYEIDITIERPSFSQKVGQCSSGEV